MSEIAGVNGLPTVQVREADEVGISGLEAEDFLRMLVTQLQYQDPTEPVGNEEILTQVSQLRDLQSATDLQDTLTSLISGTGLSDAASLIGQNIVGLNTAGDRVEGIASSARVVDGEPYVRVNGTDVKVQEISSVTAAE